MADVKLKVDAGVVNARKSKQYSQESEAWAVGKVDGVDVPSDADQYHNNAKYYKNGAMDAATSAAGSAYDAEQDALKSEGYAVGKQDGTDVSSGTYYHNNSKYFAIEAYNHAGDADNAKIDAVNAKNAAASSKLDSEAYAVGKRNGADVTSGDAAYHNNSKYYAGEASSSASSASSSESNAQTYSYDSEAWAKGTRNGVDVTSGTDGYHDNAKYYSTHAASSASSASGSATAAAASATAAASSASAIAADYDSTKTYAVGEYCLYSGAMYRCTTAITTAEAWTAGHWTQVKVGGELYDLKEDLLGLADTQVFYFLNETVSGTRSKDIAVNMPAGVYHLECDGVTSSDTQYTTSRIIFWYSGGSIAKDLSRGVAVSENYTLDHDITSVSFYGAHNYSDSAGVTFSYSNVRITQPTNLGKRLNAIENKEEEIASDLVNVKSDLEYPSVIENTVKTLTPAYTRTDILTDLELENNKVYVINVSVKSWVNTIYFVLDDDGESLKSFSLANGDLSNTILYYCYADVEGAVLYCTTSATNQDITASIQEYPSAIIPDKNESKIKTIGDSANYKFDCGFTRATLISGKYSDSYNYRASCTELLYADRDLNLTITNGYKIGVQTFDEDGDYISDSGFVFGSYHIQKGTYFKIVIAKDPEDTSTPANIDEYVNAVRINTYLLDEVKPLKGVGENFVNFGNPFKNGVYFSHIGVDQTNDIVIPCQSIADVSRARRLGFKVLELNVRKTSDDKYVCLHGVSEKFGPQFEDTNGDSVEDVYVNSMTLAQIKSGIRYKSKYARYKTAPYSLQEMLYECKKQCIIPLVEYHSGYTGEIEILNSIMGKNNYILSIYNENRGSLTDAMCGSWLTITDPTQLVNKCNASGGMYIAGLNVSNSAYSSFTNDDWIALASAVHEAGYLISFNTGYAGEVLSQKLLSLGFDASGSGWNINDFEQGNLCNLFCGTDFDGFTTNGTVTSGTLTLTNGQTIEPSETLPTVFLGGGSLHIRFNGTITLVFGAHINASFTSDGTTDMWFSTYFEEAVPTFTITATANTEVYDITYKASRM